MLMCMFHYYNKKVYNSYSIYIAMHVYIFTYILAKLNFFACVCNCLLSITMHGYSKAVVMSFCSQVNIVQLKTWYSQPG